MKKINRNLKTSFSSIILVFIVLLSMVVLVFAVSCTKQKKSTFQKPVTFTFFSADLTEYLPFTDLTAQEITRKSGVFLETQYPHDNASDAISLMIASDSYPDLIFAKGDLTKLIEIGAVLPLDDLIEEYGGNMKKLYGDQIVRLKYTLENPHIYTVGTFDVKNKVMETNGNIQLQHAVLREFGYPSIKTLDDLENALLAYKKKYPVINGHETIGYSLLCDGWYWYLGLSNPGGYLIGQPDDGQWFVDQTTMTAEYKFLNPEMSRFYKWLNRIYHEGLLDIESFTQSEDVWQSKVKGGYVLATSYPLWGITGLRAALGGQDMEERTFAYLPVTASAEFKDPSLKDYGFSGGWGVAITKSCKDPVRAFQFLDYLCSEEAQIILNWGVKDVTYSIDADGKRVGFGDTIENSGVGTWVYPFPQAGKGALDSHGDTIVNLSKDKIMRDYYDVDKETLSAYGAEMWTDLFPSSEELGVSKHGQVWQYPLSTESSDTISKIDDYVKSSLIKMILGDESDFDAAWNDMQDGIRERGIQSVTEELNKRIHEKMMLWGMVDSE